MDNNLLVGIDPFTESGAVKNDLIIRKSNVKAEGFELFKKPVQDWFKFIDKGGNPESVSHLVKGLEKLRTLNS